MIKKSNVSFKIILSSVFLLVLSLLVLYLSGYFSDSYCEFWKNKRDFPSLFLYGVPFLLGYVYVLLTEKTTHYNKIVFALIVFLIFLFTLDYYNEKVKRNYIDTHVAIITKGVITKKEISRVISIDGKYLVKTKNIFIRFMRSNGNKWKKLSVGDTILIKYVFDCSKIFEFYEIYPTKDDLKNLKKDSICPPRYRANPFAW